MLKKRRVPRVLLSLALLAPWGALRAVPGVTDTEIVIGQSLGLTGAANVGAVLPLLAKEDPPVPLISPLTGANLLRDPRTARPDAPCSRGLGDPRRLTGLGLALVHPSAAAPPIRHATARLCRPAHRKDA